MSLTHPPRPPYDLPAKRSASAVTWCIAGAVALIVIAALTGCAAQTSNIVHVPVPVPCEIPDVLAPSLPIDVLVPDADIFTIDRALWASIERLEAHVERLSALLDGCRSK